MGNLYFEIKQALFNKKLGIAEHRRFEILRVALELIQKEGFESLQFKTLAKKCKVSRPLINHYYRDKLELANALLDLSTTQLQMFVNGILAKEPNPKEHLRAYCQATLDWAIQQRGAAAGFLLFLNLCTYNLEMRKRNDELSALGKERIKSLATAMGVRGDLNYKAQAIQLALTGGVMNLMSENLSEKERLVLRHTCVRTCMLIAAN